MVSPTESSITQNSGFFVGCHLSSAKGYVAMAKDAASINASTFQFFTRNPRGGKAKELDPADIEAFHDFCAIQGLGRILAHGAYTLNPAAAKPETREFAINTLADDLARMEATPYQLFNIHPGAHVGQGSEVGIEKVADTLNQVIQEDQTTTVLLETMAGKGSELGGTFEELRAIIDRVNLADHVGVCLDTCHVWDAGYDLVNHLDDMLEDFDNIIGLDRLLAIHLNDSKNPLGSKKDRHSCLGDGFIGKDAFAAIINHPALRHLPFYLETPQENLEGYGKEIAWLRSVRNS